MESDDFLKLCWNMRIPASKFADKFFSELPPEKISKITRNLIILCGQSYEPPALTFEYFISIATKNPSHIFSVIDVLDPQQVLGCVRLFIKCGNTLFEDFKIGQKQSAMCALNALRLVLNYHYFDSNLLKEAITNLSRSPIFCILIASGRVYAPNDFRQVREQFEAANPFDGVMKNLSVSQVHLLSALFTEDLNQPQIASNRHDILLLYSQISQVWFIRSQAFLPFSMKNLFLFSISKYINNPSLTLAYFITNLYVRILSKQYNEYDDLSSYGFNSENLNTLLEQFYGESKPEKKTSRSQYVEFCTPNIEKEYSDYYPKGMTLNSVKQLLANPPNYFSNDNIFSSIYHCPMFVSKLPDLIMSYMNPDNCELAAKMADQIFKNLSDFRLLLTIQGKLQAFIDSLANISRRIFQPSSFTKFWFLLLTLVRFSYSSGSETARQPILLFQENVVPKLNQFLGFLIGVYSNNGNPIQDKTLAIETFDSISTPFEQSMDFLTLLFRTNDINFAISQLQSKPYLWPSALIWGLRSQNEKALALGKLKMPKYQIIDALFYHMMIVLTKSKDICMSLLDYPDFELISKYHISDIAGIHINLINDINELGKISQDKDKVQSIIISWRAWSQCFSLEVFVKTLIDLLMWGSQSRSDPLGSKHAYHAVAFLLILVVDEDPEQIIKIIKIAMDTLEQGSESELDGDGLAQFCVVLIIGLGSKWKEQLKEILDLKKKILDTETQAGSSKMIFSLSFIKSSLFIPNLQLLISPEVFNSSFWKHDCQTAIDFFIGIGNAINENEISLNDFVS